MDTLRENDVVHFATAVPLNITHFLGTFDYRIYSSATGQAIFGVDNVTDLSFGTRIPPILGGAPVSEAGEAYRLERRLTTYPGLGALPLGWILDIYPVISVLEPWTREETGFLMGGGRMEQYFRWCESYLLGCYVENVAWPDVIKCIEISKCRLREAMRGGPKGGWTDQVEPGHTCMKTSWIALIVVALVTSMCVLPTPGRPAKDSWRCPLVPESFQESDLIGAWQSEYFPRSIIHTIVLRKDGTYEETFVEKITNDYFVGAGNRWHLEKRPDGGLYLHLEGMHYRVSGQIL